MLHPVYYRHIYRDGMEKFKRFAVNVGGISVEGKSSEETALAGIADLENFIREIGLPGSLRELGIDEKTDLKKLRIPA